MLLGSLGPCLLMGCVVADVEEPAACEVPSPPRGLVEVEAGRFVVAGETFVPRGIGSYPLLEHAAAGRLDLVDDILQQAAELSRPVLRTNAFFDGGGSSARLRNDDGTLHPPGLVGLDRLVARAAEAGTRLILVLTNNWPDYGGAAAVVAMAAPGEGLPKDAFWSEPRVVAAQRAYVDAIVRRTNTVSGRAYASDPTIFAWELANEARCTHPAWCERDTLGRWAVVMADAVRAAGATQPVAWGGSGFRGDEGEDLGNIAATGAVDVLTLHVYPYAENPLQLGGSRLALARDLGADTIRERAALARHHGLPLLVEEMGWRPEGDGDVGDAERALLYREWLRVARDEGVGALPWMIGETGRPDYDGLLVRPSHRATWAVLACD